MRSFFQFAFQRSDGSTKFIIVETVSVEQRECVREAVEAGIERCLLLAVFTSCFTVQTFNDAFTVVQFAEFMADLAGFDGLPEELQARIESAAAAEEPEVQAEPVAAAPAQTDRLVGALTKMGFGAGNVKKWVKSLGPRAESAPLEALVKDGIRALVSAPAS